jgi:large subunit ribosomal protein L17
MNKKVFGRKLSRSRPSREALFVSLARAMVLNGKIVTTHAKAKAIQGNFDKFVTLAKKGDVSSRRRALSKLDNSRDVVDLLFKKIAPAFSGRSSGYTRLVSLPRRKGDNARMMRIEWTEKIEMKEEKKAKEPKKEKKAKSVAAVKGGKDRRGTKRASSEIKK